MCIKLFVFWSILCVSTAAVASSAAQVKKEGLFSPRSMETLDLSKEAEENKQEKADSRVSFNLEKLPTTSGKTRQELLHDIVQKDKQRLQYFANRIKNAQSENIPQQEDFKEENHEHGDSDGKEAPKLSNSAISYAK